MRGLHGLNCHSLNKDFFLIEPQSIKALPICSRDKAGGVISHERYEDMCKGNSWRGLFYLLSQAAEWITRRKQSSYCEAVMALVMF